MINNLRVKSRQGLRGGFSSSEIRGKVIRGLGGNWGFTSESCYEGLIGEGKLGI